MKNQFIEDEKKRVSFRLNRWIPGLMAGCALLVTGHSSLAQSITWNGGSTTSSNWSDVANWSGGTAIASGNSAIFSGTVQRTNLNDISSLTLSNVTFTTTAWNISGNPVTLTGVITNSVTGTSIWGLNTVLASGVGTGNGNVYATGAGDIINFTGVLSGPGGVGPVAGVNGAGSVYLSNTNNSFTGQVGARSGRIYFYSLAPGGQNSSLGAGTGPIFVGAGGYSGAGNTSYVGSMTYLGTNNGTTDRSLVFGNATTGSPAFTNSSPNNSSLTFGGNVSITVGTTGDIFTTLLAGSSAGTNIFTGIIGPTNGTSTWRGGLSLYGPGTWVFDQQINVSGPLTVFTNDHVVFGFTNNLSYSSTIFTNMTINPGATLDVSAYDNNGSIFTLGEISGFPQTLTAGHTSGTITDINGSLSLAGSGINTLNVAAKGTVATLTISSNFVPASGMINMDLNTTNVGTGSNDLIVVGANVDLSQGTAVVNVNLLHGSVLTNTPYVLFQYAGTLTGNASGLSVPAPSVAYLAGVVDVTSVPGEVLVTFPSSGLAAANLVWVGNVNNNWDINTSQNWLNGATSTYFVNGNSVTFNDSSSVSAVSLVGSLIPTQITISNTVNSYVLSGSGTVAYGALLKQGAGTATLSTANSYASGTTVSAGTLVVENASALGTGSIVMGDTNSGTNAISLLVSSLGTGFTNSIAVVNYGTGTVTIGGYDTATILDSPITIQRSLTIYCNNTTANSFTMQGGLTGTGNVTVTGGGGVKFQNATGFENPFNFSGNLSITAGANPANQTYVGFNQLASTVNTNMNIAVGTNTILGIVSSPPFNALTGGGLVTAGIGVAAYVPSVVIGSGNGSGTFSGIISSNATGVTPGVTKNGTGTEIFTADVTGASPAATALTGDTVINAGVLAINNSTGTGLNPGGVYVSTGGTLAGSGSINQSTNGVVVYGKLSVGNAGDTAGSSFTVAGTGTNGAVVFEPSGVLAVDLFSGAGAGDNTANPAAADVLNAQAPVVLTNAVLTVSNPKSMTGWAAGDKWMIANWASGVTGTFTNFNLPTLPSNLAWDTSLLYSSGVIDIVANALPTQPASITGVSIANGNIILTGTNLNGGASFHYLVLTTTNLATPLTNWTALSTNTFNANGTFNYTNALNPSAPAMFFDVKAVQ